MGSVGSVSSFPEEQDMGVKSHVSGLEAQPLLSSATLANSVKTGATDCYREATTTLRSPRRGDASEDDASELSTYVVDLMQHLLLFQNRTLK